MQLGDREKLVQVIPANGWCATFVVEEGDFEKHPLVGWAMIESPWGIRLEGIVSFSADGDTPGWAADGDDNFLEYIHESEWTDELIDRLKARAKRRLDG